jgi:hypothetical protein
MNATQKCTCTECMAYYTVDYALYLDWLCEQPDERCACGGTTCDGTCETGDEARRQRQIWDSQDDWTSNPDLLAEEAYEASKSAAKFIRENAENIAEVDLRNYEEGRICNILLHDGTEVKLPEGKEIWLTCYEMGVSFVEDIPF